MSLLPLNDPLFEQLAKVCQNAKVIVFVGLPGSGKSLFINHLYQHAHSTGYLPELIQWDVARKEFEKGELKDKFPTAEGQVHAGVRLSAGRWLMTYLKRWLQQNQDNNSKRLFIEAPLVGNRFSELCHLQEDAKLEDALQSDIIQFVLPIPSNDVREKIEHDRKAQISETATQWSGAKPSVMLQLWRDTLEIAKQWDLYSGQDDAYQADIYQQTYTRILHRRQIVHLAVNRIYEVNIDDEASLHSLTNETPDMLEIQATIDHVLALYPDDSQMIKQVGEWYRS